ncbi:DUF2785 domain-containing protein [Bacillus sp. RO2]|uniref:DUF2785 domain-containing protein n=1 Tax=Bacillus sp. RO2 TaxID=2723913 RepID=UPI00145CEA4B|nr:DUF2785 domain-containing protein [Bacillus sp. RO2]NMH74666.1 DUF2785 domain-containing protein [Bacillus sp. RO2]
MVFKEETLKHELLTIEEKKILEDETFRDTLIDSMMKHIGSTDPILRDNLIYSNFAKFINSGFIPQSKVHNMLEICLDERHLFYKIGEERTDSVFTRSFSSLVVALILANDDGRYIDSIRLLEIKTVILEYLDKEMDTRGFVKNKGWAHSIAHGADMLSALVSHAHFEINLLTDVLKAIKTCLLKEVVYQDEEDERLIFAIVALLEQGMETQVLISWIKDLSYILKKEYINHGQTKPFYQNKMNVTIFLKSLYFRMKLLNPDLELLDCIEHEIYYWFKESYSQG